ncbi:MAG: transglycosylase SLT domain-containing protein [Elusimicrobia bacterium]|nr:transglycosylase SLT domain-containing protein [Elusimicrobiota bacterium]
MAAAAAGVDERRAARCAPLAGVGLDAITRYDGLIARQAGRRGLDPRLVKAIIAVESQFSETAVSPRGARGLKRRGRHRVSGAVVRARAGQAPGGRAVDALAAGDRGLSRRSARSGDEAVAAGDAPLRARGGGLLALLLARTG